MTERCGSYRYAGDNIHVIHHTEGAPFKGFLSGVRRDWAAVQKAVSLPYSNGQTEGQVNRLKFLQRQLVGQTKFDLLWARVLHYS